MRLQVCASRRREAVAAAADGVERLDAGGAGGASTGTRPAATNVLLTFADGAGVLVPAIPQHVGALDFADCDC